MKFDDRWKIEAMNFNENFDIDLAGSHAEGSFLINAVRVNKVEEPIINHTLHLSISQPERRRRRNYSLPFVIIRFFFNNACCNVHTH